MLDHSAILDIKIVLEEVQTPSYQASGASLVREEPFQHLMDSDDREALELLVRSELETSLHEGKTLAFCCVVVLLGRSERTREEPDKFIRSVRLCLKQNCAQLTIKSVGLERDMYIAAR